MSEQYLVGDWGTTHLRLYLMAAGAIIDERRGPGIGGLSRPPTDTIITMVGEWLGTSQSIELLLCGMASSRNGLRELPYSKTPTSFESWAQAAHGMVIGPLQILLTTGLQSGNDRDGFDVMRGEEAQIFGASRLQPSLSQGSHCLVLPGTHSKWVRVEQGAVIRFHTAMTGEIYALLRANSTLLQKDADTSDSLAFDEGFEVGVSRSLRRDESLLTAVFMTRTQQLLQGRSPSWASGFLSGLLIGYEVATMSGSLHSEEQITLIGDIRLTALYQRVLTKRRVTARILDGTACVLAGMQHLRELHAH